LPSAPRKAPAPVPKVVLFVVCKELVSIVHPPIVPAVAFIWPFEYTLNKLLILNLNDLLSYIWFSLAYKILLLSLLDKESVLIFHPAIVEVPPGTNFICPSPGLPKVALPVSASR